MIKVIPAIDLIDGQCVRLSAGDFSRKKVYNAKPLDVAKEFEDAGIQYLHIVDLDAAKQGKPVNLDVIESIASQTNLIIDAGGGIKNNQAIQQLFDVGVQQVTAGSVAVKQVSLVEQWLIDYGADRLILGADVKDGFIAIDAWTKQSTQAIEPFLDGYIQKGMRSCICTDIRKDGLLQGPSIALYQSLMNQFPSLNLIASGGVGSLADIEALDAIGCYAVIVGKAIYEQKISLEQLKKYHYAH